MLMFNRSVLKKLCMLGPSKKKFKQLLQPWRLNYMILALNESMKNFLARYIASVCPTDPAWLAYVQAGTPPS